ncbi:MAG: glycosyltransferase family 39 protein [Anaerolineae bacterium]|nr:glycosyltransferase family 39 protein [Anaerolineae bacterium]
MHPDYLIGVNQTAASARLRAREWGRTAHMPAARPQFFFGRVLAILLVGLLLRMWNLGSASLWTDEVLTAIRAQSTLEASLDSLFSAGNQTPLYFMSLRLLPADSDMLLRLPSALLGLVGIALLMVAVLRLYGSYDLALAAGLLLSVNPYHVLLSRTARPYALVFVLALTISASFLLILRGSRTRRLWLAFTLASLLAYITHYTLFALPLTQVILLAIFARRDLALLKRWAVAQAIAVAPALIWLALLSQQTIAVGPEWVPVPAPRDLLLTLWNMTLGYNGVWKWFLTPGVMLVTLGLLSGVLAVIKAWWTERENLFWLLLAGLSLAVTYTISATLVSFYVDRYFMLALPAVLLLMLHGFAQWSRRLQLGAIAIVAATAAYTVLFSFHTGDYTRADWHAAADYVEARWQPGDMIVAERENAREAFERYFEHDGVQPGAHVTPLAALDVPASEQAATLEPRRVWVLYRNPIEDVHRQGTMPAFDPFKRGLSATGDWLADARDQVVEMRAFRGVTVLLVELQSSQEQLTAAKGG